jgi:hypothetical protein
MSLIISPVWCFILGVALVVVFRLLFPKRPRMLPPPQGQGGAGLAAGGPAGVRICQSCGARHAGYATYCGNCGRQL